MYIQVNLTYKRTVVYEVIHKHTNRDKNFFINVAQSFMILLS